MKSLSTTRLTMSKKRQQTLDFFSVKMRKKNEETLVQETGNSVSAQSLGLVEINSPTCDIISETSGTINGSDQHESSVCIAEPLAGSSSSQETLSDISRTRHDKPAQPILERYPASTSNGRKFSAHYYKTYEWIEYSKNLNSVFCFACRHFSMGTLRAGETAGKRAFIESGFCKWKDSSALLKQHDGSERHRHCMSAWTEFKIMSTDTSKSIANALIQSRSQEVQENRDHVKYIFRAICFLGRQGLALRGHDESETSANRGNLVELMEEMSKGDEKLKAKLQRRYGHYCSHQYQNDAVTLIGNALRQDIISEVKSANYFAILVDETKDVSRKEQLAILLRYISNGKVVERPIGCYHMHKLDAESLSTSICETIEKLGVDSMLCIAQCYDGASVMSGEFNGVQAKFREKVPHAVYVHCHAHRLNLVLTDCLKNISELSEFFSVVQRLYAFISCSNTRHELFVESQRISGQKVLELERTVQTRWFYAVRSISKVKARFDCIVAVLAAVSDSSNGEAACEAKGLLDKINSASFVSTLHIMEKVLVIVNCLSEQLQSGSLLIYKALALISGTYETLQKLRNDNEWNNLSKNISEFLALNDIQESKSPQSKTSARNKRSQAISIRLKAFLSNSTTGKRNISQPVESDCGKLLYFEVIDRFTSEMDQRFMQNMPLLDALSAFDPSSSNFLEISKVERVMCHYQEILGVDDHAIESQLSLAKLHLSKSDISKMDLLRAIEILSDLPVAYSAVLKLMKLVATLPVTTTSNERFFSALGRVKDYLRSTMGNDRLSDLMIMAVEKEEVKKLDLDRLVNDFAKQRPRRYPLF